MIEELKFKAGRKLCVMFQVLGNKHICVTPLSQALHRPFLTLAYRIPAGYSVEVADALLTDPGHITLSSPSWEQL